MQNRGNTMQISVIIPCHNSFHLMARCLQSLEDQTYKDFEVIVVDDFSKDNSYECLLDYKSRTTMSMKVIRTECNVGPGEARNIAIRNAEGQYLAFCDSDDWYELVYLDKMYSNLKKAQADLIMCNYKKIFSSGKVEYVNYTKLLNEGSKERYLALSKSSFCLILVSRDLFTNLEIPHLKNGEDIAVIPILIGRAKKIIHIQDALYNYQIRNHSQSNEINPQVYKNLLASYELIRQYLENSSYYTALEFITIKIVLYGVVLNALKAKVSIAEVKNIIENIEKNYKNWWENNYISGLGKFQRFFLKFVKFKAWSMLRLLSYFHQYYTSR